MLARNSSMDSAQAAPNAGLLVAVVSLVCFGYSLLGLWLPTRAQELPSSYPVERLLKRGAPPFVAWLVVGSVGSWLEVAARLARLHGRVVKASGFVSLH